MASFQRHFLGLQRRGGGMHDQFAAMPADAELFNHGIRLFQTEPDHGGIHGLLDKLLERKVQAADGGSAGSRPAASGATVRLPSSKRISAVISEMVLTTPTPYC
jgi:hypothetical protein